MALTQQFNLDMIPQTIPVVVPVNQYDTGTGRLIIKLYRGSNPYSPSNATVKIQGTKPDIKGFQYDATISGNTVTADLKQQMTACYGDVRTQVIVTESTGRTGTFVFILRVQKSALQEDVDISETEIPAIIDAAETNAERAEAAVSHYPYIDDETNHWMAWDVEYGEWYDTGVEAGGSGGSGVTPEKFKQTIGYTVINLFNVDDVQIGKDYDGSINANKAFIIIPMDVNCDYRIKSFGWNSSEYDWEEKIRKYLSHTSTITSSTYSSWFDLPTDDFGGWEYVAFVFNKTNITKQDIIDLQMMIMLEEDYQVYQNTYLPYQSTVMDKFEDFVSIQGTRLTFNPPTINVYEEPVVSTQDEI